MISWLPADGIADGTVESLMDVRVGPAPVLISPSHSGASKTLSEILNSLLGQSFRFQASEHLREWVSTAA